MREIKFRAWFKDKGEMKNVAMNNVYKGNSSYMYLSPLPMSDYELIELMGYTGFRDINNIEIYEGDIIQYSKNMKATNRNSEVTYVEEFGCFMVNFGGIGYFHVNKSTVETYGLEVIGNRFENPELLNTK